MFANRVRQSPALAGSDLDPLELADLPLEPDFYQLAECRVISVATADDRVAELLLEPGASGAVRDAGPTFRSRQPTCNAAASEGRGHRKRENG